jgi:hypothetical protein
MNNMYDRDQTLRGDPDYLKGLQCVMAALSLEFPYCQHHPEGGEIADGRIKDGSFIGGAVFSVGQLGLGRTLSLERSEILTCRHGVTSEVRRKMYKFVSSVKVFRLTWTSQNEAVEIDCGRYVSILEASVDLAAAKARLETQYPATDEKRYPHDIAAGTWRVVPLEPERPIRNPSYAGALVSVRINAARSAEFENLYYAWAKEQLGPNAGIIYPAKRSDPDADVYCNFDGAFLEVLREHNLPFEVI